MVALPKLTVSGKTVTLARVKHLLTKGRSVRVTLHTVKGRYVVTGLAL